MSIITVLKEADTLIFSTDSRMMACDHSGVVSDAEQKIFEITPGAFIATSGRKMASEFQIARARELAIELGTPDIQAIGAALERESSPCLLTLVERLRIEPDETTRQAVSGNTMLHGCTLVGWSAGKLGYVSHSYFVKLDGTLKCVPEAYFEAPRKVQCISGTPAPLLAEISSGFVFDSATWTDSLEKVSQRFLEAVKSVTPTIGGPWQVVRLDTGGAHWISQPPAADPVPQTAAGTCSVSVSFTSPDITATNAGAGWRAKLNASDGLRVEQVANPTLSYSQLLQTTLEIKDVVSGQAAPRIYAYCSAGGNVAQITVQSYSATSGSTIASDASGGWINTYNYQCQGHSGLSTTISYTKSGGATGTLTFTGGILTGSAA